MSRTVSGRSPRATSGPPPSNDEVIEVLPDERFPNPFNLILRPRGPVDAFQLCATVQGHEGCLNGNTIR